MTAKQAGIVCSSCGAETFLVRTPKYDGLKKVGEILKCAACAYEYASETEVPFKNKNVPRVFTDADTPRKIEMFRQDERGRICRYCRHYVVNPFTQRCGFRMKTVEATDSCADFAVKDAAAQ